MCGGDKCSMVADFVGDGGGTRHGREQRTTHVSEAFLHGQGLFRSTSELAVI
jgi:hypothetical protein